MIALKFVTKTSPERILLYDELWGFENNLRFRKVMLKLRIIF